MFPWNRKSVRLKKACELVDECCEKLGLGPKKLSPKAREIVARKFWMEGSDAQIKQFIYYAAISAGEIIEPWHFRPVFPVDHESLGGRLFEDLALGEVVGQKVKYFFDRMGNVEPRGVYDAVLGQVEKPLLEVALGWARGSQVKAARVLGINRNTLRKKLREFGIK